MLSTSSESSGLASVSASPLIEIDCHVAPCSPTENRRPCDALSGFSLRVMTCSIVRALERHHDVLAELDRRRLGLAEQPLLHHVDDDRFGELVDADRLAELIDGELERRGEPPARRDCIGVRLVAAHVPRHDPLGIGQLLLVEEHPQRV